MTSRPVTRDDVPALAELVVACDASHRAWAGEDIRVPSAAEQALGWDLRLATAGVWARAIDDGGRPVAVVCWIPGHATRAPQADLPGLAHVNAVFVHPGHWRRGHARTLLGEAEAAMREAGYEHAQLFTIEGSPAERLYQALGWTADGRRDFHPAMRVGLVGYVKRLRRT